MRALAQAGARIGSTLFLTDTHGAIPMADDTKSAAKTEIAKSAVALSRIVTQGKAPNARFASGAAPEAGLAGHYRITHGNMSFGYEKDANGLSTSPIIAHEGAIVELTAAEAASALAAKTVERVAA